MAADWFKILLTLTTTTGNQDSSRPLFGEVRDVFVKYTGQTTPSISIKTKGGGDAPPSVTFLALASNGTDAHYVPVFPTAAAADGTAVTGWYAHPVIADTVNVACTAGGAAGTITVWLLMEHYD